METEIMNLDLRLKQFELFGKLAKQFTAAKAFPKYTAEQLFVLMKAGQEMGMQEMEAINSLYIVNGKVELYGKGMLSILTRDGWEIAYKNETPNQVTVVIKKGDRITSSATGRTLIVTLPIADPMGEIDFVCTRPTASGYDAVTLEFERRAFEEPTCRRDYTTLSLEDGPVLFCVDGRSGVWRYPGAEAEDCMAGFSPVVVTGDGSVTVHTPKRGAAIVYSPGYAGGPIALVCEWQL